MKDKTPFELGYRLKAEWETHEATWIAWPHNAKDWPGKFPPIHWVYVEIVRHLRESELVRIIVQDKAQEEKVKNNLERSNVSLDNIEFFRFLTNRSWVRDFSPMFLSGKGKAAVSHFRFNAWAKYSDWKKDTRIPLSICRKLDLKRFPATFKDLPVVLEGGAIDVNGQGSLLTTEECLLDKEVQVRNPKLNKEDIEQVLKQYLGVTNVLWLGRGIAGDDTHGHVDDFARFVDESTVLISQEENPADENYHALKENFERLSEMRLEDGSPVKTKTLPMPSPIYFDGVRLPASYGNFYIGNKVVLVPTFNDPNDRKALSIIESIFPTRKVVGIHSVDLVWGFGTLHCLTHEQPLPS